MWKPVLSAASSAAPRGCSKSGLRQCTGREEPAHSGTSNSRAVSYIQRASLQRYDRCLSTNTGSGRRCSAITPQTCSKNQRRGSISWPRTVRGVVAVLADQQHPVPLPARRRPGLAPRGCCGIPVQRSGARAAARCRPGESGRCTATRCGSAAQRGRRRWGKPARNLLTRTPAWLFGKKRRHERRDAEGWSHARYEDGRGPVRTPASSPRNPGGGHYVRRRVAFPFSVRVAR